MPLPHKKFIAFLLSQGLSDAEVCSQCVQYGLPAPMEDEVAAIDAMLGPEPPCWAPVLRKQNVEFARWLRDRGLLSLWRNDERVVQAVDLLQTISGRRRVEALLLLRMEPQKIVNKLKQVHEPDIPTVEGVRTYEEIFWDWRKVNALQAYEMASNPPYADRQEIIYALARQNRAACAIVGVMPDIPTAEEAMDEVLAVALLRSEAAMRSGGANATAQLDRLADLLKKRQDMVGAQGGDMIDQARKFLLRRKALPPIPSLEDIMKEENSNDRNTG